MPSTRPPRPRRLRVESLEHREVPAVLTTGTDTDDYVTSRPTDWDGTDNLLSLREAIRKVNAGADNLIDFGGLTVQVGTQVDPLGHLPAITRKVTVEGGTLDGNGLPGGLNLTGGGTVRDMTIIRMANRAAVRVVGTAVVENNFLGTDANGTPGLGNGAGVSITGSNGVVRNNVIAGNAGTAVGLSGSSNRVVGNKIGVAPDGVTPLPNGGVGVSVGARSADSPKTPQVGNVFGGPTAADRNIIAGFGEAGVVISYNAQSTRVVGNYIGLTAAGTVPLGGNDGVGVLVEGTARGTVIGGANGNRNWITGVTDGVFNASQGTTVIGNVIGLQTDGTAPLVEKNDRGVVFRFGSTGVIGQPGAGNIISGSTGPGIYLVSASQNKIQSNWIGLDLDGKAGTAAAPGVGNGGAGIQTQSSGFLNNIGGGSAAAGNVIAGNEGPGISIEGETSYGNRLRYNTIGLDAAGELVTLTGGDRGNRGGGVLIGDKANGNTVGEAGAGNVISGNTGAGVRITDVGSTNNRLVSNRIGTDRAGTAAIGNGVGVRFEAGAMENVIGDGTGTGRNLISGNVGAGIEVNEADGTLVLNNRIGTNAAGTGELGNGGHGIHIQAGSAMTATRNTIAYNGGAGIQVDVGIGIEVGSGNTFDGNAAFNNAGPGIVLAPGANAGIGRPSVQEARKTSAGGVRILGSAQRSNEPLKVQLFGSPAVRADFQGEGAKFLGTVNVTADAVGGFVARFPMSVPAGFSVLTITVTDVDGNTSEYSLPQGS